MIRKSILLAIFLFEAIFLLAQQEQMYTQFMFNKLAINPAYAGHDKVWSATALYRNQWIGFDGAPEAQNISINAPLLLDKIGFGLNLKRQSIGISEMITVEGAYAYKMRLGEGLFSLGLQVSGRNYKVNYKDDRLFALHGLAYDPSIPQNTQTKQYLNTGFGVYFNLKSFYIGASLPRLIRADLNFENNKNKEFFSQEKRHLLLMSGIEIFLDESSSITPQLLVKLSENSPFDFDLDINYNYKEKYTMGLNYRYGGWDRSIGESIDVILGMQMNEKIFMAVAYDIGLSKLRAHHNGSLELMVHYKFKKVQHTVEHINPRFY